MPQIPSLYGLPVPLTRTFPAPIIAQRAPTTADIAYPPGQVWVDQSGNAIYQLLEVISASASWLSIGGGAVEVQTLTGTSGGARPPTNGNITITGTAPLSFAGSGSTLTGAVAVASSGQMNTGTSNAVVVSPADIGPYYKFASWTPNFAPATGASTFVYAEQTGYYARIDRLVWVRCRIALTSYTIDTAGGDLLIQNFPFAAGTTGPTGFQGCFSTVASQVTPTANTLWCTVRMVAGTTNAVVVQSFSNAGTSNFSVGNLNGTAIIEFSGMYTTDAA